MIAIIIISVLLMVCTICAFVGVINCARRTNIWPGSSQDRSTVASGRIAFFTVGCSSALVAYIVERHHVLWHSLKLWCA